jgi:hypothetical protein
MALQNTLRWLVAAGVLALAAGNQLWQWLLSREMAAACAESPEAQRVCTMADQILGNLWMGQWILAALAAAGLLVAMQIVLRHSVEAPAAALKEHFRRMALGQWRAPLPKAALAAPAGLPEAVKELGEELESAFLEMEQATRRASLALFVRSTEQQLDRIEESIAGIRVVVEAARAHRQIVPAQAVDNLKLVSRLAEELRASMDAALARELGTGAENGAGMNGVGMNGAGMNGVGKTNRRVRAGGASLPVRVA